MCSMGEGNDCVEKCVHSMGERRGSMLWSRCTDWAEEGNATVYVQYGLRTISWHMYSMGEGG